MARTSNSKLYAVWRNRLRRQEGSSLTIADTEREISAIIELLPSASRGRVGPLASF
jgi:hypothetical protein